MKTLNLPILGDAVPVRGWWLGRAIGWAILKTAQWSFAGGVPNVSKAVIIVAPHTSNWDFVVGAAAMLAADLDVRWLGKHTLFEGPLAPLMSGRGGIPVTRSQPGRGVVEEMAELIKAEDHLMLALAPEGTRSRVDRWKTGFHRIALAGGVPIIPAALDYRTREIRFGPPVVPCNDTESDVARLQLFFSTAQGKTRETPNNRETGSAEEAHCE